MVCSSVNIEYQSTGVGSLPSLSEIEVRRLVRGVSLCNMYFPMNVLVKNSFFGNIDKSSWRLYEENKSNETIPRLLINTVPAYMPIDEISIVRSFLCSV